MKTKKRSRLMVIFLSFLVCVSLMPMTTFAGGNSAPKITNGDNMPFAVEGKPYEYTFTATAGGTVTWEKVGAWPDWLKLDSRTGKIYGTPTLDLFNVKAKIRAKCIGSDGVTKIDTKDFSFFVCGLPDFFTCQMHDGNYANNISGTNLPDATQNSDYLGEDYIIFSSFRTGWPIMKIEGVPEGMSAKIDTHHGTAIDGIAFITLDGTPTNAGTYSIKVTISGYADQEHTEFIGTTEKTFTLKVNPESSTPQEEVTVSFDKNGGIGTMADVTVNKDTNYTLPTCGFTAPDGKEFKAWEVNGVEKSVGDSITVNANTTVKAIWKAKTVIVNTSVMTIKSDGGKWADGTTTPKTYTVEVGKYFTLPEAPIKDGYTFLYWEGSKYNPGEQYLVTELDHTFTAVWQKNEVKPDNKGNTSSVNTKKVDKTSPKTGDNGMMYVYALELLIAASGMLILNARRNKNNLK